jgi:signal transduction histidine kinase
MAQDAPDLDVELALANGKTVLRDYVPLYSGTRIQGHLWIFRDITERKQLEHDQEQAHRQLAEQNRSLLELDRLKTELVATVSHELRTPLTSIISFAELLLDTEEVDVVNQRRFTEIISNNAHRLLVVVGDLLLLGRAEAGNLRLQPGIVEIPAMIDEVVAALEPAADAAGITLSVTSGKGPTVEGDAARLDQVLDNLVSNAVKFTPAGGEVTVASTFVDRCWHVTVTDTGMGIPRAEQDTIFERFQRATNAATTPGTGLGLAVAKTLVELHGGSIALDSIEGSGTTVTLRLPVRTPAPHPETAERTVHDRGRTP